MQYRLNDAVSKSKQQNKGNQQQYQQTGEQKKS